MAWIAVIGMTLATGTVCAGAADAATVSFGANLASPANNPATCGQGFAPFFIPSQSCTWFSGAPGPTFYAPASGTITAVRVRVGAVTGPMQVVVMRSLYQNKAGDPGHPYFACCFVERYGPIFEPVANTVTTLPVDLPVIEEATPPPEDTVTNAAGDFLALSVLASNVPIPMFIDNQSVDGGFYPAVSASAPSPNPVFASTDTVGAVVLMNADLDTGGGAPAGATPAPAGPTPPPAPPAAIPAFALPRLTVPVRGGTASVPIQCLVLDCSGLIALQSAQQAGAARAANKQAPRIISYGTARFSLKAGTTGKVKVRLNAAGRRLVRSHRRAKVWANVRFTSGAGSAKSARVTLKR